MNEGYNEHVQLLEHNFGFECEGKTNSHTIYRWSAKRLWRNCLHSWTSRESGNSRKPLELSMMNGRRVLIRTPQEKPPTPDKSRKTTVRRNDERSTNTPQDSTFLSRVSLSCRRKNPEGARYILNPQDPFCSICRT